MSTKKHAIRHYSRHLSRSAVVRLILTGLLLYAVAVGVVGSHGSVKAVESADLVYLLAAVGLIGLSYAFAAATYKLLSPRRLPYGELFMVQLAGGLVNRLLPGGLGGLGINAYYLYRRGCTAAIAGAVVTVNNTLGFIGNTLLCLPVFVAAPIALPDVHISSTMLWVVTVAIAVVAVSLWLLARKLTGGGLYAQSIKQLRSYFRKIGANPGGLVLPLLSSMILTALQVSALYMVLLSLGVTASWSAAFWAVSAGALIGGIVPSPGGLGGAEAGIAGALAASGVPIAGATIAALVYRGITYWLPLIPGYLALRVVEKKYL